MTSELEAHLAQAAELAATSGLSLDAFMHAAWCAYMEKHPHVIEQMQAMRLVGELTQLKMQGRLPSA